MWFVPGIYLGGKAKKSYNKLRLLENAYTEQVVFVRLLNQALQKYDFEGLPETVSKRTILESLLWYGCVVFYEYQGGLFALPGNPTGDGYNVYGDPGAAWVYSQYNGKLNKKVNLYIPGSDEAPFLKELSGARADGDPVGVIVWENKMRYPFITTVFQFSHAIADCYRTLDITRMWLKIPLLLTGPEEYAESVKTVLDQIPDNPTAIYLKEMVGVQKDTTLLNTNANGQNLQDVTGLLEWYENQFRGLCGLDSNAQMDKKGENLITAEITVNDQFQQTALDESLDEIQKGLDDANKFFGLNMRVVPNKATQQALSLSDPGNTRGDDNGNDDV